MNRHQLITLAWCFALCLVFKPVTSAQVEASPSPNLNQLFQQAQDAHEKQNYVRALELYDTLIEHNPDIAEVHYQRGQSLVALRRDAEAEAAFKRALELRAEWALPQTALKHIAARRTTPHTPAASDKNELLKQLRRQTAAADAAEEVWLRRAQLELELDHTAEALTAFNRLVELNPRHPLHRFNRARLALTHADVATALGDLQVIEAVYQPPANQSATASANTGRDLSNVASTVTPAQLASLYAALGDATRRANPSQSLNFYERAAALAQNNPQYATGYAAALVQARRFPAAAAILKRILAVAPDNYAAHANLAIAYDEQGLYREALSEYLWLKAARPELALTNYFIARMHDKLGDYVAALAAYQTFLQTADTQVNADEIDRVKLRLTTLREQAKKAARQKR